MNPSYIYFKELDIDSEDTFGFDFSKSNEIENVILDKDYEYAITGLNLNVEIPEGQVIKIEDEKKKKNQVSTEIENLIENHKKLDLTLYIVNTEIFEEKIPFTKKNETELPLKKYTYFDRLTKKSKTVSV